MPEAFFLHHDVFADSKIKLEETNDGWDETGWCCDEDGLRLKDFEKASGVSIPEDVMDEFVLMCLAELIRAGQVPKTIERFLSPEGHRGNFGGLLLEKNADTLEQILSQISLAE